ncbi:MAG: UPF0280 family protein [Peptococcaceae bacterium]|nr:UPF0280 family protein [Peptococcaceae bacterium]
MQYIERSYRQTFRQDDLVHFQVVVRQTDLDIGVRRERFSAELARWVEEMVREQRALLENYIKEDSAFLHSLTPCALKPGAPPMAVDMAEAARRAGVGPMAAVAGAFAQHVGRALARRSRDVIVENGGDIYLRSTRARRIGIFAGRSPLSNRIALEVRPEDTPLGICTSSGTVGPSLSFGSADAVVILSPSAALADAVATAAGNMVQDKEDVQKAAEFATGIAGVTGALVIKDDRMAACGKLKLVPVLL